MRGTYMIAGAGALGAGVWMIRWYCCAQEEDAAEAIIKNGFRIDAGATPGEL